MGRRMRRREFLGLIGGAAGVPTLLRPRAAQAQQSRVQTIGFLYPGSPEPVANRVAAFRKGLSETGFNDGRDVKIEFRWAHNEEARLPELAADLVRQRVSVLVASPAPAVSAAKAATTTIPIVFYT